MKKIFLTSYLAGTKNLVGQFLNENFSGQAISFIPTAADVETYTKHIDKARNAFTELGYTVNMLDISALTREQILNALDNSGCCYIAGGNTFYLLWQLKEKNLVETIKNRVDEGMVYLGESAGAMIASDNVTYSALMDDPAPAPVLTDYNALGIVDFYTVPHVGEYPFAENTAEMLKQFGDTLPMRPINNWQAITVRGGYITIGQESSINPSSRYFHYPS